MRHAIERAAERYGVTLTDEDLAQAEETILGDGLLFYPFKSHLADRNVMGAIRVRCRWIGVLVSPNGFILTVLPEGRLGYYRKLLDERKFLLRRLGLETKGPPRTPAQKAKVGRQRARRKERKLLFKQASH